MVWYIFLSSLILSFITLVPLGIKWEVEKKTSIPSAFFIGVLSGLMVNGTKDIWNLKFYEVLALECFMVAAISISALLWRFYRDPERTPPGEVDAILSPADGKVIYIKKIINGEIPFSQKNGNIFPLIDFAQSDVLPRGGYLIGISMNFLDVHVNRAPIGGKISLLRHIKGTFISLKREEAVFQNERALTVIENGSFKVGIVQIASRLVRKIVLYLREGGEVQRGAKIGAIRFGSQVDLIIPNLPTLSIVVSLGQKVEAGISIVARFDKGFL